MADCYRCGLKPAIPGDGLCEDCAKAHAHMGKSGKGAISLGKSYEDFFRESLYGKPKFEGLILADDVLLQYEYYKYDHRFLPLLGAGSGSYRDEHKKLEEYFFQCFLSIFKERIYAIDGEMVNEAQYNGIKDDFFRFHSAIIQFLLTERGIKDPTIPYIGNALTFQVQLLLKKELIRMDFDPSPVDIAGREFDPGSALFFLELYVLLREKDAIQRLQQIFTSISHIQPVIIHQPVVMLIPWAHQKQAFESWLQNGKNGIIEMATATGKTLVGLMAIEALYEEKPHSIVRIFAHSTNILNQWRREVVDKLGILDNSRASYESPINIDGFSIYFNTLQTVYKNPSEYPADLLIADEVHHLAAPEFRKALTLPCTSKLGLSATVEGEQRSVILKEEIGEIVYRFTLTEALERGVLPSFQWIICPVYLSIEENEEFSEITNTIRKKFQAIKNDRKTILEFSQGTFAVLNDLNDFIRLMEYARYNKLNPPEEWKILIGLILKRRWIIHRSHPRLQEALKLIHDVAHEQKAIVFAMDIRSCDIIADNLKKEVKNLYVVHSKVKDDVFAQISSFKNASNGVLIGARMLDEGIDIPDASIGINVASSKTRLQLIQRLGRILRQQKGKKPVFYHYVALPEREDLIEEEDHLTFLDDLAWVQDTALKLGLSTEVRFSDEIIRGISKDAEQGLSKKFYSIGKTIPTRIGTFNPDYILKQFSPESIDKLIPEILKLGKDSLVSDREWSRIVKFAHGKKETDGYQMPGFWWLLVLANRDPYQIIRLFRPDFDFNNGPLPQSTVPILQKESEIVIQQKADVGSIKLEPVSQPNKSDKKDRYESVHTLTSKEIEDLTKEAIILLSKKNFEDARAICQRLIKIEPKSVKLLAIQAACSYSSGEYQKAEFFTKEAIKIEPDKPTLWENLSKIYKKLGLKEKADYCDRMGKFFREKKI